MSRQINLLVKVHAIPLLSARRTLALVCLQLAVLLAIAANSGTKAWSLGAQAAAGAAEVAAEKSKLADLRKKSQAAAGETAALAAELAQLTLRAKSSESLLKQIGKGDTENLQGYAAHMQVLARIAEDGVWLTAFAISEGGKKITLEGRALSAQAVLDYAKRANAQFAPLGVKFSGLDLQPPPPAKNAAPTAPAEPVGFKFY